MLQGEEGYFFENWAGTFSCRPEMYFEPTSLKELKQILRLAIGNGKCVKAVGYGHSPSDIGCTDDYLVSMRKINGVLEIDTSCCQVTVEAGILLEDLNDILHKNGLGLSNLGSISDITVGGAIATGTHGTGIDFGILATQVVAMEILVASGDVVRCSEENNPEIFKACLCSIGALGIVTMVTIQCEPAFNLCQIQTPNTLDNALLNLEKKLQNNEHYRFMWYACTEYVVEYRMNRTEQDRIAEESWFWGKFVGFHCLEFVYWIASFIPSLVPWINRAHFLLFASKEQMKVDRSDKVFNFDCLFKQFASEWSVDINKTSDVLQEIRKGITEQGLKPHFPIEVRFVKNDKIFLSPTSGHSPRCFINIGMFRPYGKTVPYSQYWEMFTSIMRKYGGRPHWAKAHDLTAEQLSKLYPDFEKFCSVRHQLDPTGLFLNGYLRKVVSKEDEN